jgi:hypothetical protein
MVTRQRLGINPFIVAIQRLCDNLNAATNTNATIEELTEILGFRTLSIVRNFPK